MNLLRRLLDLLASLKLSLVLFFALAVTSAIGTLVKQSASAAQYGPFWGKVFQFLGFNTLYQTLWFKLLLTLLLVNTFICSFRRLPRAWRLVRRGQFQTGDELRGRKLRASWEVNGADAAADAVDRALRGWFRCAERREEGGQTLWFAQKQPWARMGAYVTHLSLALFFIGALVGAQWGFKGTLSLREGETSSQFNRRGMGRAELGFSLTLDDFELHTYPDGNVKDYLSHVSVHRDGQLLRRMLVEVNEPLIQEGIYFYQSRYSEFPARVDVRITDPGGKVLQEKVTLVIEQPRHISGNELKLELFSVEENLNSFGPAAQLVWVDDTDGKHLHVGAPIMLLQRFPDYDRRRGGPQVIELLKVQPASYRSTFQVALDPGVNFIWAGSILMCMGALAAVFASHRRLWIALEGERLTVAGLATKNKEGFERRFDVLIEELRKATSAPEPEQQAPSDSEEELA